MDMISILICILLLPIVCIIFFIPLYSLGSALITAVKLHDVPKEKTKRRKKLIKKLTEQLVTGAVMTVAVFVLLFFFAAGTMSQM